MHERTRVPTLITDDEILDERAVTRYLEHLARHPGGRPGEIEQDFVEAALRYSTREHIAVHVWKEFGVPSRVLERCGFERQGRDSGEGSRV